VYSTPTCSSRRRIRSYSDHLLLQSLVLWPLFALTGDIVLCYNLLFAGSLVAAALAMHVLARTAVGREWAAYVAGFIFGFAPYHFTHLGHLQLQALYWLPLALLFLHRLFSDDRGHAWGADTVALGVVMGLQTVSSVYYGVIGGVGVVCAAVALALGIWRPLRASDHAQHSPQVRLQPTSQLSAARAAGSVIKCGPSNS
jgi:hypothetical protein